MAVNPSMATQGERKYSFTYRHGPMPKKADPVLTDTHRQPPAAAITHGLSGAISLATGMANVSPRQNQPICVKLMRAEGR